MMQSKPGPWRFARPELAKKYLQTFEIGLISAQALLRRLQKDEPVVKLEYGHYQIQEEGFVEWLRQRELEE